MTSPVGGQEDHGHELVGRAALIASVGGQRGWADWANPGHRLRRLLAEFIGMAGLTFVLSGGAAILVRYLAGPVAGAIIAVAVAYVLRGSARAREAGAAVGTPLDRSA